MICVMLVKMMMTTIMMMMVMIITTISAQVLLYHGPLPRPIYQGADPA